MATNTMKPLDLTRRRCAAYMTFSEVINGEVLMQAMWMLEERDHSADKMTFIGFFGITAELLGLDNNIITTLYPKLNRNLDLPKQSYPEDPMPQMLKFRGVKKHNSANDQTIEQVQKATVPAKKTKGTPEMTVFAVLISKIIIETKFPNGNGYSAFKETLKEELFKAELSEQNRHQILSWANALNLKVFKKNIVADELCSAVHCIYIALCEAFGPVKADSILDQAIQQTSKSPAAKTFSPRKLL